MAPLDDEATYTLTTPMPVTPADSAVLWGASIAGIYDKLPTRAPYSIDAGRCMDALETVSGLVAGRVGSDTAVPAALTNLAAKVIETGAAAIIEQGDFPEQSSEKTSLGMVLWARYESLLQSLAAAVEEMGGEPPVSMRPAFNFPPPSMYGYMPL